MSGFHHEFKFCLVGPSRVGKTTIKIRATDDIFTESYLATIGPEFVEIVSHPLFLSS
jgi:GTPase SAR1 family protein